MAIVIDASVALAWCFPDEETPEAVDNVASLIAGEQAIVPGIFWYEVRNILVRAERRGRIESQDTGHFLSRLDALGIVIDREHNEEFVLALARRHQLTVDDAAYFETALRRQARIATLDNALAAASVRESVENLIG